MISYSRLTEIQRAAFGVRSVPRDQRLIPGRVEGSKRSSKQAYRDYMRDYMRKWRDKAPRGKHPILLLALLRKYLEALMPMTDAELREWSAILDEVTRGPYRHNPSHIEEAVEAVRCSSGYVVANVPSPADAAHISRCDPQTIGEMIDELLSKRRILEDWEEPTRLLRARVRDAALDEAAALVEHHGETVLAEAILALKED